jgi:hypothetical protein
MNKHSSYGDVALVAVSKARGGVAPVKAWTDAAKAIFSGRSAASRDKCCPRCVFLGLIDADLIRGVPRGNHTKSKINKHYAVEAVKLLKKDSSFHDRPMDLWRRIVVGRAKQHNGQMGVVVALWENGDIYVR